MPDVPDAPHDVFGSGEVARDLAAVDWAATPLGEPRTWPVPLASMVRVLLSSRFSMWMAWGPELTFFCNDAYRRDTLGSKYPWALGRPASEVWAEIWPDIEGRIEHVMRTREATWDEALMLFLERSGYREETYHTFSYSPLADDDGAVAGMLCVVSEDTERVVGARRMALVRDLGAGLTAPRAQQEVLDVVRRELGAADALLPFTLVYLLEPTGEAVLAASTGLALPHDAAPPVIAADGPSPWPREAVLRGETAVVDDLDLRFPDLPTGGRDAGPRQALVVPFRQQDETRPLGFLVAGLTRYRPLDDDHRGFVELVAGQVAASLAGVRAHEQERLRAERLLELDRAKTDFFTNVSHEFRTPLTLMLGPAEDALTDTEEELGPRQRERVEVVRRNGERLLKLVDTLLDFSRLESGTVQAQFEPADLTAATAELAETFRTAVERVGLSYTVSCEQLPGPVWVDREMWAKVVLNLLSNALKFTFDGGIDVRLEAAADGARLTVTDTGTGIEPEQQVRLFERFARVAGARSRSLEGSGIGLALVQDLAGVHGGTVALDSEPGRGSSFTVTVPWGRDHLPAEQVLEAPSGGGQGGRGPRGYLAEASRWLVDTPTGPGSTPAPGTDRPRVLVVDDNADMREYVTRLLAVDHEVLVAADGRTALEIARRDSPDLVLSDVMMPGLDGVGLMAALREDARTAHVPVVLVSARAGEDETVRGLEAGADDYLAKPFSSRELRARVRANLELDRVRRTRRELEQMQALLDQAQRLARVGSWEVDVATGAITASTEFVRQADLTEEEVAARGFDEAFADRVHPDDRPAVEAALARAVEHGEPVDYLVRLIDRDGGVRTFRTLGELERDAEGRPLRLRGSNQDVTEQLLAEEARAAVAAATEAAGREHRIADELQRSLLPEDDVQAEELSVASFYSAGAEGTQVGGDWYDVIGLGGGRTALVVGDVMGRGVRAAAVMGQLRSAVRAFARLDLPPSQVLEYLDGVVRDLGDDQIVTCLYGVYDPYDATLTLANAGHLPPLVRRPGGTVERLEHSQGPPLGTVVAAVSDVHVTLESDAVLVLYTDGLVEDRSSDIDDGIDALSALVAALPEGLDRDTPAHLVRALLPGGSDDDVAVLMAQVQGGEPAPTLALTVDDEPAGIPRARREVGAALTAWGVEQDVCETVLLLLSELVTNALVHGRPPVHVRVRRGPTALALEVHDSAQTMPRRGDPDDSDEHGRGLQLVSAMSARWGTRPTMVGKAVWCTVPLG
ncbi:SpoIIE family protein phosphatase [Aquipuribacter hungaricus]|uniref:histidine kinase n=1 Tax=Aquipuribacter hungaricus TaxID=545624 RepID=A0ABV7WDB0_9MICO